ncbi:MAG: hypothetical protein RIK87_09625 [Fuerstiella sp.]
MADSKSDSGEEQPDFSFLNDSLSDSAKPAVDEPQDSGPAEHETAADSGTSAVPEPVAASPDFSDIAAADNPDLSPAPVAEPESEPEPAEPTAAAAVIPPTEPTTATARKPGVAPESRAAGKPSQKTARRSARRPEQTSAATNQKRSGATDRRPRKTPDSAEAEAAPGVSRKLFSIIAGYAAALTLLFILLLLTGRLSLSGSHPLESLPDIRPLQPGEFKVVPETASLPALHRLALNESRRFGDVVVTPLKVTREIVRAVSPARPDAAPEPRTDSPVLKLWFQLENAADDIAFAPWDVGLMSHRSPEFTDDDTTVANSWLKVAGSGDTETRVLNFLHSADSQYQLVDQHSGQVLAPGEAVTTYIACGEQVQHVSAEADNYRWRLQIRKGIHRDSHQGVTTLIDIHFTADDIQG